MLPKITCLKQFTYIDAIWEKHTYTNQVKMTACNSCNPRQDKYSKKVYKYFVEFSDKESKKKTYSETERRVSEKEKALKSFVFSGRSALDI